MKIIALLPVRNEMWILPTFISSVSKVVDEIIVLDDGSSDGSGEYLVSRGASVYQPEIGNQTQVSMSARREWLLEKGRAVGGTHFIWLDADEAFSAPFLQNGKRFITSLKQGQKLQMQWLALWKDPRVYRDDESVWSNNYKDFIVCDDPSYCFEHRYLSEGRTQGPNVPETTVRISPADGVVLHFQFVPWRRLQVKQAWYRCKELIYGLGDARSINATYAPTLDDPRAATSPLPEEWLNGLEMPSSPEGAAADWQLNQIFGLFTEYGVEYFEALQIWHVPELRQKFIAVTGRAPVHVSGSPSILDRIIRKLRHLSRSTIVR